MKDIKYKEIEGRIKSLSVGCPAYIIRDYDNKIGTTSIVKEIIAIYIDQDNYRKVFFKTENTNYLIIDKN